MLIVTIRRHFVRSRVPIVPNTVPTPRIEALRDVAIVAVEGCRKCLEINNGGETLATVVPVAKLLICRGLMATNQKVGSSNLSGRTIKPQQNHTSQGPAGGRIEAPVRRIA